MELKKKWHNTSVPQVSAFPRLQAVGLANHSVLGLALEVSSFPRASVRELDKWHFIEPNFQRSSRISIISKSWLSHCFYAKTSYEKVLHPDKKRTIMYLSSSGDKQCPWVLGIKPITTALPIPSSPSDTTYFLSTSLATLQAAPVSWVGASCRRKCGKKIRLHFFEPQFLWHLHLLLLAKQDCPEAKQSSQNEPSSLPLLHYTCMSCALYKFKTICRTQPSWKVGQWKNRSRDSNNNIASFARRCK